MENNEIDNTSKPKELPRRVYGRPDVAWPTVLLFGISAISSILSFLLGSGYLLPFGWCASYLSSFLTYIGVTLSLQFCTYFITILTGVVCMIISSACSYAMFTVAHDAIHGAVTKNRRVNNLIGFMSQLWLGPTASWHGIKYNHLTHHAHTNDSKLDPDYWCSMEGPGGYYLTPLRWFTVDVSYLITYLPTFFTHPFMHQLTFVGYELAMICTVYYLIKMGCLMALLQYWIIPARIAIALLAFAFDFLPHYPHDVTRKKDRHRTTSYVATGWIFRPFLSLIIFYQNYHIAHHLVPIVPFYEYKKVWNDLKEKLLTEHDIRVMKIFPQLGEEELPVSPAQERRVVDKTD